MRFDIPYHSLYAPDYIVLLIVTKNLVLNNYIYIYIYVEYHLELVMFLAIGLCQISLHRLSCLSIMRARVRGLTYYSDSYVVACVCRRALQGLKVGHQYALAGTMCSSRQKVSTINETKMRVKHKPHKTHGPFGFMVNVWVVLCAVVTIIIRTLVPIESKLVLRFSSAQPVKAQVPRL